jgi:hypothetical protein
VVLTKVLNAVMSVGSVGFSHQVPCDSLLLMSVPAVHHLLLNFPDFGCDALPEASFEFGDFVTTTSVTIEVGERIHGDVL